MKVCVIAINEFKNLTAHPIFVIQLCKALSPKYQVELLIPRSKSNSRKTIKAIPEKLGYDIKFKIIRAPYFEINKRLRKSFYLISTLIAKLRGCDLLWSFEPYSIRLGLILGMKGIQEIHASLPGRRYLETSKKIQVNPGFMAFVTNSKVHNQLLQKNGLDRDKLIAAYNAFEPESLILENSINIRDKFKIKEKTIAVYTGSLYPGRGIEEIAETAEKLTDLAFLIVGGPESRVKYYQQKYTNQNIYFGGYCDHKHIYSILKQSTILLAPFQPHSEDIAGNKIGATACPMKIIEYLASGKPIITTNMGAIPEIIKDNETGVLIDPGQSSGLVDKIQYLVTNPDHSKYLAINAFQKSKEFTWEKRIGKIMNGFR